MMGKEFFGFDDVAPHDKGWELLETVRNNEELAIIRGILDAAEIPYMVKERGSGSYVKIVFGFSNFGTDIFVPAAALEEARARLANEAESDGSEEDIEEFLKNVAPHDEGWSYLTSAHDDEELKKIFTLLDAENIRYTAKFRETGETVDGMSDFCSLEGVDVFVPDESLDCAADLVVAGL